MTPQSSFAIVAPLEPRLEGELRALLASMNRRPGVVDPRNALVPFAEFERLHFARFVVMDDQTRGDVAVYGVADEDLPTALAFLGDCDGPAGDFLAELADHAGEGLRRIFSHCRGFASGQDLRHWLQAHARPAAASYVNWVGRTVRQVREEAALRDALRTKLDADGERQGARTSPRQLHADLRAFVAAERQAGRLTLMADGATPLAWRLRNLLHLVGVPIVLLLLSPLLLAYLPIFALQLRRRERTDPEIVPPPDRDRVRRLADLEDHDVTNQFSALGRLKPGRFRRWTVAFFLWIVDYGARHIYARGYLARVSTIHFARWIFLDDAKRLLFASNYDGSLESYMDDFINKVAWGLNLVFSNGVGYPRTDWLILGGAKDEQKFKHLLRRHQLPTEVWYKAYPGLTTVDLDRNARIRQGIERASMTDEEAGAWLQLL